jgi:predicted alpha/beta superfamily hydrolase
MIRSVKQFGCAILTLLLPCFVVFFLLCTVGIEESAFARTSFQQSLPQSTQPPAKPASGRIVRFEQFSSRFVMPRNIDVWLPQTYDSLVKDSAQKFAVLYMHDGQMLFDSTNTWNKQEWGVDETMTALLQQGAIKNCIVVGIWNTGKTRHSEYFPKKVFYRLPKKMQDSLLQSALQNKVQSDAYLKFLTQELKPFIDSAFRTNSNRESTFIAGSSMGGLISLYALCEYPQIFGGAACLSTHWIGNIGWNNGVIPRMIAKYLLEKLPTQRQKSIKTHTIYFDYGTKTLDSLYKPHQIVVDKIMTKKNYSASSWMTKEFAGEDHSERAWAKRLYLPLQFLLGMKE